MTEPTAPQRTLLDYLLAYHRPGFSEAARAALPLAAACDLERLRELGLVELRYVPVPQPQAIDIVAAVETVVQETLQDGAVAVLSDFAAAAMALPPAGPDGEEDDQVNDLVPPPPPPTTPKSVPNRKRRKRLAQEDGQRRTRSPVDHEARKASFLKGLRLTGSLKGANVHVGLNPNANSWNNKARLEDPEFARACEAAIAACGSSDAGGGRSDRPFVKTPAQLEPPPAVAVEPPAPEAAEPRAAAREIPSLSGRAASGGDRDAVDRDTAPFRRKPEAEIVADSLRHLAERRTIEAGRRDLTVDEAKLEVQRAGFSVCRADVVGGRADRWAINGVGKDITDAQLIERAERILARKAVA